MKKRLLSILTIIACMCLLCTVSVTSVSAASEEEMKKNYPLSGMQPYVEEWIGNWNSGDFSKVDEFNKQYQQYGMNIVYDATEEDYKELFDELGSFKKLEELNEDSISYDDTNVVIKCKGEFENKTVDYTFTFITDKGEVTWIVEAEPTMGELVGKAGLNTLMGMGTVFCVLIFISFIISLFKVFNKAGSKKPEAPAPAPVQNAEPAVVTADDNADEIAAVIAAAIAMYEEEEAMYDVPSDGLFVRSIKKRGFC